MTKKRKPTKKSAEKPQERIEPLPLKIVIDDSESVERKYSNHIRVSITPLDATLDFCDLGPLTDVNVNRRGDHVETTVVPKIRISLSHEVLMKLGLAIKTTIDDHREIFGVPDEQN